MAYLGCEGGDVVALDARRRPPAGADHHRRAPARVKAIVAPSDDPDGGGTEGGPAGPRAVTASSDGVVRLGDVRARPSVRRRALGGWASSARDEPVAEASGGGRPRA